LQKQLFPEIAKLIRKSEHNLHTLHVILKNGVTIEFSPLVEEFYRNTLRDYYFSSDFSQLAVEIGVGITSKVTSAQKLEEVVKDVIKAVGGEVQD